jgi:hypothetical protein
MDAMRLVRLGLLAAAIVAVSGCGSPAVVTPAPHTATPTPRPTPSPTATPGPDTEQVQVVSSGFGVYQAVVVPVAILHNAATRTGVRNVSVHFAPSRSGRPLQGLDSPAVTLYPGETLAVTADCTDGCNNTGTTADPDGLVVTVQGGTWASLPGSALTSTAASFTCVSGCGGGHGQWDVTATVGSPELAAGTPVDLFTWCTNSAGTLVGGNPPSVVQWPQAGGSLSLTLHAIVSSPPVGCSVGASAPI